MTKMIEVRVPYLTAERKAQLNEELSGHISLPIMETPEMAGSYAASITDRAYDKEELDCEVDGVEKVIRDGNSWVVTLRIEDF